MQAAILRELIADGRKTPAEIAKATGISREDVRKNYTILEEIGVINGATIHINYKSFGYKAVGVIIANVSPTQAEQVTEYLRKRPEVYFAFDRGPKGNIEVTITIKALQDLDKIKDLIKNSFSVSETRTVIWTDVKEMHWNMTIADSSFPELRQLARKQASIPRVSGAPKKISVDEIDLKISDVLAENGRTPMDEIAQKTGISVDTAKRRYERLKKNGILKVTIQFDPTKVGYLALGVFFAETSNGNSSSIIEDISKIPDVISIMKTTGYYDLQIFAFIKDLKQLLSIQEQLGKTEGISKIDSRLSPMPTKWPSPRQHISTF